MFLPCKSLCSPKTTLLSNLVCCSMSPQLAQHESPSALISDSVPWQLGHSWPCLILILSLLMQYKCIFYVNKLKCMAGLQSAISFINGGSSNSDLIIFMFHSILILAILAYAMPCLISGQSQGRCASR